jgi:segregation and condensation protein A
VNLTLTQFTGPFDLLLSLVEGQELKITEIALSEVTEQYLQYLDTLEETEAEELADFLVVAAKLLYMKSKRLLPEFMPEEEKMMKMGWRRN